MLIEAHESELDGRWDLRAGQVAGNATSRRIRWLVEHHLLRLGNDLSGWDTLYRDPGDGRLWELTYPQSDSHGGGPPRLACLNTESARTKYGEVAAR